MPVYTTFGHEYSPTVGENNPLIKNSNFNIIVYIVNKLVYRPKTMFCTLKMLSRSPKYIHLRIVPITYPAMFGGNPFIGPDHRWA